MITPRAAAKLCQLTYIGTPADWDKWLEVDGVAGGIKGNVIALRGSKVFEDFIRDAGGVIPVHVDGVGTVGAGLYAGVEAFYVQLGIKPGDEVIFTGHSLGCCHAAYLARLAIMSGAKVSYLALFAPPRAGYVDLHMGLLDVGRIDAFINEFDLVPDVPVSLPDFPWTQFPHQILRERPDGLLEKLDPVDYHSIALYARGVPD